MAEDIGAVSPCGAGASRGFDGPTRGDKKAKADRVLEIDDGGGERGNEADGDAANQGKSQNAGDHAWQNEEGRIDSQYPDGRRLHALLRSIERGMPVAGLLLAE